jgi:hypothetical protein
MGKQSAESRGSVGLEIQPDLLLETTRSFEQYFHTRRTQVFGARVCFNFWDITDQSEAAKVQPDFPPGP